MLNAVRKVALLTALVLMVPALAMRFTPEVRWGLEDFAAAAVLLFSAGMAYALLTRRLRAPRHRLAAAAGVLLVLGLFWAELAVGLFD
jgi:hypothetical protein